MRTAVGEMFVLVNMSLMRPRAWLQYQLASSSQIELHVCAPVSLLLRGMT